jgi:hypothetical protein
MTLWRSLVRVQYRPLSHFPPGHTRHQPPLDPQDSGGLGVRRLRRWYRLGAPVLPDVLPPRRPPRGRSVHRGLACAPPPWMPSPPPPRAGHRARTRRPPSCPAAGCSPSLVPGARPASPCPPPQPAGRTSSPAAATRAAAQLEERIVRNEEVGSSTLLRSTLMKTPANAGVFAFLGWNEKGPIFGPWENGGKMAITGRGTLAA